MAGTIDQLNFEVILDDKEFTAKVQQDIKLASQLNTSLSSLLNIKKQVGKFNQDDVNNNRKAQQILKDNVRAQEAITREKLKTEGVQKRINAQIERATKGYQSQSRILNELKGIALGYLSVQGAGQLLSSLVRVTGEFELQKTTLAAMLGDLNKAEGIITRIQGLAVESPFQFKELTTYAKQLSAFSVPAQELYDTTKMLADISAGLGVGMDRIVLAYGQVRSAAFLRGQEVRQFTEAGIPILNELAKQFSELEGRAVSAGEVFDKISARLVPFEMVAQVFKDMTSEGGKFYNMQEVQAETLRGKISNLKDAYEVMLNEIGKGQSENLKGAVDWARRLMQNYEETGRTLVELVAAYGTYRATLAITTNLQSTLARNLVVLRREFRALTSMLSSNPYALLAASITAVGYGIYKASTSLKDYEKIQKEVSDAQVDYTRSIAKETSNLDALYAKLRVAKKGTEEYEDAKKKIYTQYASYISELKNEGVEISNLAGLYDGLKDKIENAAKARFRLTAAQGVEEEYANSMDAFYKRFELLSTNMGNTLKRELMEVEKEALWQYLLGDENALNIPDAEGIRGIAKDMGPSGYGYLIEKAQKDAKDIIDTYAKAKERIDQLFGKAPEVTGGNESPFAYNLDEESKGKSPAQKAIEEQIKSVQKLQDAYEKLLPYLNEVQMKSTLKAIFPNIDQSVIDSLDFNAELERLADRLEEFDEDAAQRLRDTIGKDVAGTIAESFKAVEQYKKMLDSWLGEDFELSGSGVSFDISKIIRNLNNEYAKIDQKRAKALDMLNKAQMGDEVALAKVREVYGDEVWQKYLVNGKRVIEDLARMEKQEAKKTADEKIRDLANKYVKEQLTSKNVDLTDFEDKTLAQIQTQIDRIKEIRDAAQKEANKAMVEIALGNLDDGQYARWQMLIDVLKQLDIIISDTEEEKFKTKLEKASKLAENISNSVSTIGDALSSLGNEINNDVLSKLGGWLSEIAGFAQGLTSNIKTLAEETKDIDWENDSWKDLNDSAKGGVIGIIAGVASLLYNRISGMITSAYDRQRALTEATYEYRDILIDIRRESYSGIFGTDEMGLATENVKILNELMEDYKTSLDDFNKSKFQGYKSGLGREGMKNQSLSDMMTSISESQGWDLYLENGELNIAALEAYYDAYSSRLTKKQRDLVLELIERGKAVDDAAAQQSEYLTSLFGNVADNIATSMIDAFLESGDAAIDMGNIISDVSKQMVADLVKTLYLMPILNDYKDKIAAVDADTTLTPTENTEQKLQLLESALQQIAGQSDAITETIARFQDYLGKPGEETSNLGDGIKGITEDTANLLASYLNAIRADVSFSKTLWIRMDANTQRIAAAIEGFSAPSLMEYQAQIAANTYNTSVATQSILATLRAVVDVRQGRVKVS